MTEMEGFRTKTEEVSRLLDELAQMRELLREISGKLSRLEMRAKRAFPHVAAQRQALKAAAHEGRNGPPQITPDDALRVYDRVVERARSGAHREATELLEGLSLPDLLVLHKEVGLTLGSK